MYLELSHDAVKLRSKINREMELTPSPYRCMTGMSYICGESPHGA